MALWHKKYPVPNETDDIWKLTDAFGNWHSLAFAVRQYSYMPDHSQSHAPESTRGYFAQWLHAEAAHLALTALLCCSPMAWQKPAGETMEGSMRNLPWATLLPLLERWSPAQHPQLPAPARIPALTWPWSCWSLVGRYEIHTVLDRGQDLSFPNHASKHRCLQVRDKETVNRRWDQMVWPSLPTKLTGSRWTGEHKLSLLIQGSVNDAKKNILISIF